MRRTARGIVIVLVSLVAGCASPSTPGPVVSPTLTSSIVDSPSPATTSPTVSSPATQAPTAGSASGPPISPIPPTTAKTIGTPADDGARMIAAGRVDQRVRDLRIDSPSVGVQHVRLLLPPDYDARPTTHWPVLYLLHGAEGSYADWTDQTDLKALSATTEALIVMPDGGAWGWYSDWWNHGGGGPPMWEQFHVVEIAQLLERNWHAGTKRAVAGLSMGGLGAIAYAARHPGFFAAAASFSGVLDSIGGAAYTDSDATWGDPIAQLDVWKAHDPLYLAPTLKGVSLYISYGDGTAGPFDNGVVPDGDLEAWIAGQDADFVARLHELEIPATVEAYGPGTHSWPYWERGLHHAWPLLMKALGVKG